MEQFYVAGPEHIRIKGSPKEFSWWPIQGGISVAVSFFTRSGPEVTKFVFIFNSVEHEICPADKSKITNKCKLFLSKHR